jgi:hypothetical protein
LIPESIKVIKDLVGETQIHWIYLRTETDEIRRKVDPKHSARINNHAFNNAVLDFSKSDMIIINNVGVIFSPDYFKTHIAEHVKSDKVVVLGRRFDLFSDTYHEGGFKLPWEEVLKGNIKLSGGWPDLSVKRNWMVEMNGWDEWYQFAAPADMDIASRLTGRLDNGQPSEQLYVENYGPYANLGLGLIQPYTPTFMSLTCNTYKGHVPTADRIISYNYGVEYYQKNWGKIYRNENRIPTEYVVVEESK